MSDRTHWESLYRETAPDRVSWYQDTPEPSLELIRRTVSADAEVIDVGGGASKLVDALLAAGFRRLTVLDLSAAALAAVRSRLGGAAAEVSWVVGDVLEAKVLPGAFDLWHDRAVFHFLTAAADRTRYVEQLRQSLKPDGHVVMATFAPDAPPRCSGLEVARYAPEALHAEMGPGFRLLMSMRYEHRTPAAQIQPFTYAVFRMI